jgi:hypothetical protein
MVSNLDIWRAANLLIRQHGDDADLEAARLCKIWYGRGSGGRSKRCGRRQWQECGRCATFGIGYSTSWFGVLDRLASLPETP